MKSLLLVIDLQKSFINENTKYLIDRINNLVNSSMYDYVIFTKFISKINSTKTIAAEDPQFPIICTPPFFLFTLFYGKR